MTEPAESERYNPCRYSPEVLDVLAELIRPCEHVHDPFAGHGSRLAALCDQLGAFFTGGDIEVWRDHDPRVVMADACDPAGYPPLPFTVVTSPVYLNGISSDYKEGPTPTTKLKGRRAYGISLGHALHPGNLARTVVRSRPDKGAADYFPGHGDAVKYWGDRVIVNVDLPMSDGWQGLLTEHGYVVTDVIAAFTHRYGGLDNAEKRADHEVVIVATRGATMGVNASERRRPTGSIDARPVGGVAGSAG
jgi:hypothetical protein